MRGLKRRLGGRRALMSMVVAAGLITASIGGSTAAPSPVATGALEGTTRPTIVLVHGAWADGSGWSGVIHQLVDRGYRVVSPANPLRGLASDADYLRTYLETSVPGPVVLVGHSYGGAVMSMAAEGDPDVRALVYVDAFAPAEGESILHILDPQGQLDPSTLFDFVPLSAEEGDVDLYLKREVFPVAFANGIGPSKQTVLEATQRPIRLHALAEPAGAPAWDDVDSYYVLGTEDHIIPEALQRQMAVRAGSDIVRVKAGHLSMISDPTVVATTIHRAIKETRPGAGG
ncbi:alpha/beta hydrolase [Nocardioides sp. NPDC127514]|uniref:alpha/beta fold hydrolase n=1 Tax=unclassified Nocardioides TaxID=2615069 RepID=UPI0033248419